MLTEMTFPGEDESLFEDEPLALEELPLAATLLLEALLALPDAKEEELLVPEFDES